MTARVTRWVSVGAVAGAAAALAIDAASFRVPPQQGGRSMTGSSSVGSVSPSVIASWTAHGTDDGVVDSRLARLPVPPPPPAAGPPLPRGGRAVVPPPGVAVARPLFDSVTSVLDFMVLWRWPGQAPEMTHGDGGQSGPGIVVRRHRIVAGGRELHVDQDTQAGTALVDGVVLVQLAGANVLMLDVGEQQVTVAGTATIAPYAGSDAVEAAIAQSPVVAAFVNR